MNIHKGLAASVTQQRFSMVKNQAKPIPEQYAQKTSLCKNLCFELVWYWLIKVRWTCYWKFYFPLCKVCLAFGGLRTEKNRTLDHFLYSLYGLAIGTVDMKGEKIIHRPFGKKPSDMQAVFCLQKMLCILLGWTIPEEWFTNVRVLPLTDAI